MSATAQDESPATVGGNFARVLSFGDLVVYGLVYIAPVAPWVTFAYVYELSGGAAVLAYLIGIACMYFTANSYKEMCGEVSGPGSAYAYARKALGVGPGFIAGWMVLLDYLLVPALMYVLAAVALNTFVPEVPRWVWVIACACCSLTINWYGIAMTARANFIFLFVQLFSVAGYIAWALYALPAATLKVAAVSALWSSSVSSHGLFAATFICVLSFLGFDAITTLTEEVKPEQRHLVGRSVVAVLLIIGGITVINVWVMSLVAHGYQFGDPAAGAYEMTGARVSVVASISMAWIFAMVTGIAITPPMVAAVSRVLYAMASGGQLPGALAVLHPTHGVPHRALLLSFFISIAVALVLVERPDELTSIVNFGAMSAYIAVNVSLIAWLGVKKRSGRWMAHILMPSAGIVIILAVMTQMGRPALIMGMSWLACGVMYCALLRRLGGFSDEVHY